MIPEPPSTAWGDLVGIGETFAVLIFSIVAAAALGFFALWLSERR